MMLEDLVASYIAIFFMLDTNIKRLLHNEFNTNLLCLGVDWWKANLASVQILLIDKYHNQEAANSVQDFVNTYNKLF